MSVGKRMREARKKKGYTQERVAEILGIDDTTISKYENDKSEADNKTMIKMASLYGVEVSWILTGQITKEKKPVDLSQAATEVIIREYVEKYNIDLTAPGERQRLEDILKLIYAHDQSKESK